VLRLLDAIRTRIARSPTFRAEAGAALGLIAAGPVLSEAVDVARIEEAARPVTLRR
jgi:hypothetical protein